MCDFIHTYFFALRDDGDDDDGDDDDDDGDDGDDGEMISAESSVVSEERRA